MESDIRYIALQFLLARVDPAATAHNEAESEAAVGKVFNHSRYTHDSMGTCSVVLVDPAGNVELLSPGSCVTVMLRLDAGVTYCRNFFRKRSLALGSE